MTNTLKCWVCFLLTAFVATSLLASNHPGNYNRLAGDDFSLEGALDLFKSCGSLEDFERELNASDNTVNNLDLNNNGRIDYLRVVDHAEGNLHAIVIQALIEEGISQDVAVIEVKQNRYGEAVVQIVGDEDLYGTAKIVEPYPYDDVVGTDYYDDYYDHYSPTVFLNAWAWPSVRFIFAPRYVVWVSPYYYDYYPIWYRSWNPYSYNVWNTRTVVYHHHYCVAPNYRIPDAHHYYGSRRVSAPVVHQRTERYVEEHGGRSNFDYSKRNDQVEAPHSRSLDRTDKPEVATRTDRPREQSPTAKPQANDRNLDRSQKPETAAPNTRQREQSPTANPQVTRPQANDRNLDRSQKPETATPTTRQREQGPPVKPQVNERRPETVPAKPKVERSTRQMSSPARETTPRTNNAVSNQSRSNQGSPQAPARTAPKTSAAPKVERSVTNSRSTNSTSAKAAPKSERSQGRKGNG